MRKYVAEMHKEEQEETLGVFNSSKEAWDCACKAVASENGWVPMVEITKQGYFWSSLSEEIGEDGEELYATFISSDLSEEKLTEIHNHPEVETCGYYDNNDGTETWVFQRKDGNNFLHFGH